jgi:heavy metal sensor kinase
MNTRSLRFQVLLWYTGLLSIGFAAVALFLFVGVEQLLMQNLKEILAKRSRQIAHFSAEMSEPLTTEYLRKQISALYAPETPESNGRFVRVTTEKGVTFFQSGVPSDGSFDPKDIPFLAYKESGFHTFKTGRHEVVVNTTRTDSSVGSLIVEVGASTALIGESVRQILLSLLVAAPCLLGIAAVGAYFLVGRALRPMVRLAESAEAISLHNLKERLPVVQSGDELQALSLALNRMIGRIEDAVEATKRFVADASHELRTPLAVLRGELETVLTLKNVTGAARDTLASNLEEVERLAKIVQRLLALSRLDSGEAQGEIVDFDVSPLVASTAEQLAVLAEDKGLVFHCDARPNVFIHGDPARIKQVLVNIIDNAINYTPEGGRVEVRSYRENSHSIFQVTDSGIGIAPDSLPHIFERFYRADKARSREAGGAGLGLSIVQAICAAHNAEIKVESEVGKGTKIKVIFASPKAENSACISTEPYLHSPRSSERERSSVW